MSQNSLNIEQMKNDYPFLKELWDLYDGFDKSVEGNYKGVYDAYCNRVTSNLGHDKVNYHDICMKLLRNLDPSSNVVERKISPIHCCFNVNNWLYNNIEKNYLNNKHVIKWIFDLSKTISTEIKNNGCFYYSYDTQYNEPVNIILLRIFDDNIDVIERTLKSDDQKNSTLCQNYVCKCVDIYQKMNKLYCSESNAQPGKRRNTCDMLKALKTPYNALLSRNPVIRTKIPSLEATEHEFLTKCPSYEPQKALAVSIDGNSGSSTSSKIPATIGTMAGVSSVFALLYKVNIKFLFKCVNNIVYL
ncbi:hypothetical protein PVMG_04541 [Plasmodium vivax Mauritania I]|uniref:Uncharacterized protein n=1 Tax=Plasmodium vivax Mauritania I TaxID=1035515 RepID=A0A0J9T3X7_PLAVI|nr:hypothetical protein PVMG_04541 [Plasmodium vivax Mauritania I]